MNSIAPAPEACKPPSMIFTAGAEDNGVSWTVEEWIEFVGMQPALVAAAKVMTANPTGRHVTRFQVAIVACVVEGDRDDEVSQAIQIPSRDMCREIAFAFAPNGNVIDFAARAQAAWWGRRAAEAGCELRGKLIESLIPPAM